MLLTLRKQLRSHPAVLPCVVKAVVTYLFVQLIPLFFFIGGGATMSLMYLARLGLRNPDVCWDRKNNPEPWNKLSPNYQYKFFAVNTDYSKLKKDRPDF